MRSALALAIPVVLLTAGCSSKHEAPGCRGPLIALNAAHWQPTPAELDALAKACPEAR